MTDVFTPRQANRMRLSAALLLPPALLALAILIVVAGAPLLWPLLIGAAGWLAALILRQPVALLASRKLSKERTATVVGWFSGPAEELVRLVLVLLAVHTVQDAAWFGYGWATIEILVVAVNILAMASLLTKDDPKSREARELLAAQGVPLDQHPVWALVERVSAIALHLGFTLMLFASPWLVLVTLPAHSLINMMAVTFSKKHIALTELGLAVAGAVALTVGILLV